MKTPFKVLIQAFTIAGVSTVIALSTNALRADGIPVIAQVPYDIFAPCRDSDEQVSGASSADLARVHDRSGILTVDARPEAAFAKEHINGAMNVPYSVLFGASRSHLDQLLAVSKDGRFQQVIVYGAIPDPAGGIREIDLSEALALELKEIGVGHVKHLKGNLIEMKKLGFESVHHDGDKP